MNNKKIITRQLSHIKNNFKEYLKILTPIVFVILVSITFSLSSLNNTSTSIYNIIFPLISLYLWSRLSVNINRLIILKDNDNYFLGANKLKTTIIFMFYTILYYILFLFFIFVSALVIQTIVNFPVIPQLSSFPNFPKIFQMFVFFIVYLYLYSLLALNFPKISIGKKIQFLKMFTLSKGVRNLLFFQIVIFIFLYILSGIIGIFGLYLASPYILSPGLLLSIPDHVLPPYNLVIIILGFCLITASYVLGLFIRLAQVGCLAHTFLLCDQKINSTTNKKI